MDDCPLVMSSRGHRTGGAGRCAKTLSPPLPLSPRVILSNALLSQLDKS